MKFSTYPLVTSLAPDDKILIHQDSSGSEKTIAAIDAAEGMAAFNVDPVVMSLRFSSAATLGAYARVITSGYAAEGDGGGGVFYYHPSSTEPDNNGTVIAPSDGIGRWKRPDSKTLNVKWFGARGDDSSNDIVAIQSAIDAASKLENAAVYFPSGVYLISSPATINSTPQCSFSIYGDGASTSIIKQTTVNANGLDFTFNNSGVAQPFWCSIRDLGIQRVGTGGTGIVVSYGNPAVTSNHRNPALTVSNVSVKSNSDSDAWENGVDVTSAWNCHLEHIFCSGSSHSGTWSSMTGAGLILRRYCVNSHISNCQASFFRYGFLYDAGGTTAADGNTEGLFFTNCSFSQVVNGCYVNANGNATVPRMSGFRWTGGMTETRAQGYGFYLKNCWDFSITNCFLISADNPTGSCYGVVLDGCGTPAGTPTWGSQPGGIISGCEFYAFDEGVRTEGTNNGLQVRGNTFHGVNIQVRFNSTTTESSSGPNLLTTNNPYEINANGDYNKILQGNDYNCYISLVGDKTIANTTDTVVTWGEAYDNETVNGVLLWNAATPTRINLPSGVTNIGIACGIKWAAIPTNGTYVKVKDNLGRVWASADQKPYLSGDMTVANINVPLDGTASYLEVTVNQSSGGALNLKDSDGTFFCLTIIN